MAQSPIIKDSTGQAISQAIQALSAPSATNVAVDPTGMEIITANNSQGALKQLDTAVDSINSSLTNKLTHVVSRTRLTSNATTTTQIDLDSITINKKSDADLLVFVSYIISTSRYTSGIELYADDAFQASAMISETSPVSLNTWFIVSGLSAGQHTLKTKLFAQDSGTTATCYSYNANTIMALEL